MIWLRRDSTLADNFIKCYRDKRQFWGFKSLSGQAIARKNIAAIVAAYRKVTGRRLSAVSRHFYGNADFLKQFLRPSRKKEISISFKAMDKMLDKFRDEWPEKADWPCTEAIFMDRVPRRLSG